MDPCSCALLESSLSLSCRPGKSAARVSELLFQSVCYYFLQLQYYLGHSHSVNICWRSKWLHGNLKDHSTNPNNHLTSWSAWSQSYVYPWSVSNPRPWTMDILNSANGPVIQPPAVSGRRKTGMRWWQLQGCNSARTGTRAPGVFCAAQQLAARSVYLSSIVSATKR